MEIEDRRQALQAALDAERTLEERNPLGQFATPPQMARLIARIALGYCADGPIRFLEPSIGSGAFYAALLAEAQPERVQAAVGVEVDPRFAAAARALWAETGLKVAEGDFSALEPPQAEPAKATLVLANPPYVRHHHLEKGRKAALQAQSARILGRPVSGLSGLYVHFLLAAHRWMAEGGVAAWLVPAEWMDVNYGAALRTYLSDEVQLLRVHRFEAADVQFGDALVSSSIVVFRKTPPAADARCELTAGDLLAPRFSVSVKMQDLRGESKWSVQFRASRRAVLARPSGVALGDLADVRRGVATGGNGFFIQPRAVFRSLGIPDRFLRPVLPSSRYLPADTIPRGPDGFPALPEPLALLGCDLPEAEVRASYPRLWAYLESPQGQRTRTGYLTSRRRPWYAQEKRPPAPILATYMGRGSKGGKPFRFFWNQSDATATNVYLLLIPKGPLAALLQEEPQKARLIVDFLDQVEPAELCGHGRVYGGGLYKLEPRELGRLDATALVKRLGLAG